MKQLLRSTLVLGAIAGISIISAPSTHATMSCVDGTVKSNLFTAIAPDDTVTVTTKNNAPLCKDLTLHWDSYTMPDTYNGQAFNQANTSVGPQTKFSGTTITIKAGQNAAKATIKLPECKNVQTDLYYGNEITTVTSTQHHGVYFIDGEINGFPTSYTGSRSKDLNACAPKTPEVPVTPTTPVTPETPGKGQDVSVAAAPQTVTELPSTGTSNIATGAIAALLAAAAYGAALVASKKHAL